MVHIKDFCERAKALCFEENSCVASAFSHLPSPLVVAGKTFELSEIRAHNLVLR